MSLTKLFTSYLHSEDLKSLEYLKYCLKESLRLFPPVSGVGRVLAQPTEIDGYKLPQGSAIVANFWVVHHHPDFWENPFVSRLLVLFCIGFSIHTNLQDFDPLRFSPERSKGRHSHAFIPFSAGSRYYILLSDDKASCEYHVTFCCPVGTVLGRSLP